jgi:MFS transporter, ACS family, D-galactonate transporter
MTRRWSIVSLLFAASLINYLDRASMSLALPRISGDLHLDATKKGVLLSSFFWSYTALQIPMGLCVDRFPLRWFYAGMFALWSLACGMTGLASSLAAFLMLRLLLGVGESIYYPGGTKVVALLFDPSDRGLPSGLFNSGTRAGIVVGGMALPWLIVSFGWRTMFRVLGFGSLIWLMPWLATFPASLRPERGAERDSRFRLPPYSRHLLGICLGFFCFDYFLYLLLTWLPDYLVQARHLTIMRAGVYSALPFITFTAGEASGGWIGDRLVQRGCDATRTRKSIITAAFLCGLLLIPAVLVENATVAIALIVGACCAGLAMGNLIAMVQNCAPPGEIAAWAGLQNFAGNCGGILAPLITGILLARTGSYMPGFVIAAILLALGLLPYWTLVGELAPPKARQLGTALVSQSGSS